MNIEEAIAAAAKAIENRKTGLTRRWLIGCQDGRIACIEPNCSRPVDAVFMLYSEYQLTVGLTSSQWTELGKKIIAFLETRGK